MEMATVEMAMGTERTTEMVHLTVEVFQYHPGFSFRNLKSKNLLAEGA